MTVRVLLARTALISFITLAFLLGSSVGNLAIQEGNWPARGDADHPHRGLVQLLRARCRESAPAGQ